MKKKRKEHIYNLNRTILTVMMVGYLSLLLLLGFMDWYLLDERRREILGNEQALVHDLAGRTEEAIDKVGKLIYDVYAFDSNFEALSRTATESEEYSCAYELRESLKQTMAIEENFHGFYLFYGNREKALYNINTDVIKPEQSVLLKQALLSDVNVREGFQKQTSLPGKWAVVLYGQDQACIAVCCRKGSAALYGIYSMGTAENTLLESSLLDPELIVMEDGVIFKNKEMAKELGLPGKISGRTKIFSQKINHYYVYGERIENTDLWIFSAFRANFWQMMTAWQVFLLVVTALSAAGVGLLYFYMKRHVIGPLRQLTCNMDAIREGRTQKVSPMDTRFMEIRQINDTLQAMLLALKEQQKRTVREAVGKERAQIQYLQLQLKPHFYLNGLKTLNALALEKDTDKMQEMILNLSSHIRYLLQMDRETVPLSSEIEFVKNYIELQKHVTGRPVSCSFDVCKEALAWQVPVLCIQTFVENSVKYAKLGDGNMPLKIEVLAQILLAEESRFLDLIISDNGQGYPEKILNEINEDGGGNRSIGINNIKKRCRLLYGNRAEYMFDNMDGAQSELILPEGIRNEYTVSG